jgi:ferredoxin
MSLHARDFETCALCPRLCRHVCPVAVATGREAATPTAMMTQLWDHLRGAGSADLARSAAHLCTSCGACTTACKLDRPVGDLLATARAELSEALPDLELPVPTGEGRWTAVEADERTWGPALSAHLNEPVAVLRAHQRLGASWAEHPEFGPWADRLRAHLAGRSLVVADGDLAMVCRRARIDHVLLSDLIPAPAGSPIAGCTLPGDNQGPCCGAIPSLGRHHPQAAADMADLLGDTLGGSTPWTRDAHCAGHLRAGGTPTLDPIDILLALQTPEPTP